MRIHHAYDSVQSLNCPHQEKHMTHAFTLSTLTMLAMLTGSTLVGCEKSTNSSGAVPQTAAEDHNHGDEGHAQSDSAGTPDTYSGIHGQITQLPDPGVPGSELKIHHQQIRDFKTKDGTVNINKDGIAGMRSMTMPFPVADGVSLEGLQVGDKISFDFVVNWGNNRPAWEVTAIQKLPADTEIDFNNAIEDAIEDSIDGASDAAKNAAQDMMDHSGHNHESP